MPKKVVLVNTTTTKKDKISTLFTKIKTIEIRSENDLISITDISFELYVSVPKRLEIFIAFVLDLVNVSSV